MEDFKLDAATKIAHLEESVKLMHKRLDSIESLAKSVYELAASIKTIKCDITDMSGRLKVIEEKPAKRWDLIITGTLTAVVGGVVGYLLHLLLPRIT